MKISMALPRLVRISNSPLQHARQKQRLFSSEILIYASVLPNSTQSFIFFMHQMAHAIS